MNVGKGPEFLGWVGVEEIICIGSSREFSYLSESRFEVSVSRPHLSCVFFTW